VEELLPLLAAIGDRIVQAHYLQRLARLAQVRESALHQMLLRQGRKRGRSREAAAQEDAVAAAPSGSKQEEFCLALLLRYPELRQDGLDLSPDLFWYSENRELLQAWQRCPDLEEMRQAIAPELEEHLQRLSKASLPPPQEAKAKLQEYVEYLKKRELKAVAQANIAALADREAEGGPISVEELAAAAQASRSGSPPEEIGSAEVSQTAALLLEGMEIGIRLHRSSRIETGADEGLTGDGPEVEVNG
jgi:DNA primase